MTDHVMDQQRERRPDGARVGVVRPELRSLVQPAAFVPERAADRRAARAALRRDGAVVVTGYEPTPDGAVRAAADLLGAKLDRLYPARLQPEEGGGALPLHSDGSVRRIEDRVGVRRVRTFLQDYLFILCADQAEACGGSVTADGYRLLELLESRDSMSELVAFLTGADLDYHGLALTRSPALSTVPQVRRPVEFTRTGRRVISASAYASALQGDPQVEQHEAMSWLWTDVIETLTDVAPRFRLGRGEVLCLDNYRSLHGRDTFDGNRAICVLEVESVDAR